MVGAVSGLTSPVIAVLADHCGKRARYNRTGETCWVFTEAELANLVAVVHLAGGGEQPKGYDRVGRPATITREEGFHGSA